MRKKKEPEVITPVEVRETQEQIVPEVLEPLFKKPDLFEWQPTIDQCYFFYDSDNCRVSARFEEFYNIEKDDTPISKFKIKQGHYQKRMPEICQHINYFITFYDPEMELYNAIFLTKFLIDRKPFINQKDFQKLIIRRFGTPTLIDKIRRMACDLYIDNIADNDDEKYVATPKITNTQAKQILAISFCVRMILPLCLHYTNINETFDKKTSYIPFFDRLIMKIISTFEKNGVGVFNTLCRFVEHRVDKNHGAHYLMWAKKKQLYGVTRQTYLDEVIHEVIIVKGLYKLDYRRSVVSFIDGVIFKHHINFKRENFKTKPVEIDQYDATTDSDNYLSHAESLEMQAYKVDASSAIFTDVNNRQVLKKIRKNFRIEITPEELEFYMKNMQINTITESFVHDFYARIFSDTNANLQISEYDTVYLIILLKKYLQIKGLSLLPQLCTAKIKGRFKENLIKNAKFTETVVTSNKHQQIIEERYKYIDELFPGEMLNLKMLSTYINSEFEFVDYDNADIHGYVCTDIDINRLTDEYDTFLSII